MKYQANILTSKQKKFLKEVLDDKYFINNLTIPFVRAIETVYKQGYYLNGTEQINMQLLRSHWIEYLKENKQKQSYVNSTEEYYTEGRSIFTSYERRMVKLIQKRYKQFINGIFPLRKSR